MKLAELVVEKKIMKGDRIPSKRIGSARFEAHRWTYPTTKKQSPRVYSTATSLVESELRRYYTFRQDRRRRRHRIQHYHRSPAPATHERTTSESGLKVQLPLKKRYWKANEYWAYRLIYKSLRFDYTVPSEIQNMRKKRAVQMKDQVLNGKDSTWVINFSTEFK